MNKTKRAIFRSMSFDRYNFKMSDYLNTMYRDDVENGMTARLKADLAFQAAEETRWTPEEQSSYITNLITNKAPSTFVFADIESCRTVAEEESRISDFKYFDGWHSQDIAFLNIDSNNRNISIYDFLQNGVNLLHGQYQTPSGNFTIDENNDTFDTMPELLRQDFLNSEVLVTAYTDATREELSELFVAVNDGRPLIAPEKRNASTSNIATYVRKMAKDHKPFFTVDTKWFTKDSIIRRGLDDFIASMLFFFYWGWTKGANKDNLASMYKVDSLEHDVLTQFKTTFNKFMKWIPGDAKGIANRNSIFDLFFVYKEFVVDMKYDIKNKSGFIKAYITVVSDLIQSDYMYEHSKFQDPKSFETMVGGRQVTNNQLRNEAIMKKMRKEIHKYAVKLDPKRTLGKKAKMISAANQNFKTPEEKPIDLSKLQTSAYHNGHGIAHSNGIEAGGTTTLKNNFVQEAKDNLKLGKKNLEKV